MSQIYTAVIATFSGNADGNATFTKGRAYPLRPCRTSPDNDRIAEVTDDLGHTRVILVNPDDKGWGGKSAHLRPVLTAKQLAVFRYNPHSAEARALDELMDRFYFTKVPLAELNDVAAQ